MTDKQKKVLYRIIATALLYAVLLVMEHIVKPVFMDQWYVTLVLFLIPYFVIGWDIMYKAVRNISHGQVFDENFLMLIATIGAFVVGEYSEGVAVMLFYQVGELFQSYAELCSQPFQTVYYAVNGHLSGICQSGRRRQSQSG